MLCDYLDAEAGRAAPLGSARKLDIERHMEACAGCADLARDAGAAVRFMERAADVEPPPELVTRILFELPQRTRHARLASASGSWLRGWLAPVLQPKFVMGMALTVLSFSMMAQCAGVRVPQLRPADLAPSKVWAGLEDRIQRTWDRGVKSYHSIRFVYELQSRLRELTEQQQEEENRDGATATDERRLPAGEAPAQSTAPDTNKTGK